MPNIAWGIDLGNRALKAVKLVRDGGRFRVDDYDIIEHEQILSMAGDNKESLIQSALAQFGQRHSMKGAALAIGVSGQSSFARFIKLPPVEPKRIPEIVKFEAVQQIPFPLGDVEWAYQLFKQTDSPDVEVGIFAIRKDLVNHQIQMYSGLGGSIELVQMSTLAIHNAMMFDGRVGETTMFMDMGAENTDLIITDGATVWLRTLQIGGNSFTDTLAKMFKLSFTKAEELKRNATTSKYAKQIFMAMRPVFADLVVEIQRSMNFYSTVHRESRIARIVVLGSTFQLPGLQKYLQQNLQMPVDKLDGFGADKPEDAKIAAACVEHASTLATAYGLAVQALGEGAIKTSLLPEAIQRAKMWRDKTKWFMAAAASMLLATGAAGGYAVYKQMQYDQNDSIRQANEGVINNGKQLNAQWTQEVQGQGEADRVILTQIQSLHGNRDTWLRIIDTVFSSLPEADYVKLKSVPRDKRELLLIDQIQSSYMPNARELLTLQSSEFVKNAEKVAAADATDVIGVGMARPVVAPMNVPTVAADGTVPVEDPKTRGFLLLVTAGTSNKQETFLDEKFVKNLLTFDEQSNLKKKENWYIARVEMVDIGARLQAEVAGGMGVNAEQPGSVLIIPPGDIDLQAELVAPTTFDITGGANPLGGGIRTMPFGGVQLQNPVRVNPLRPIPGVGGVAEAAITYDDLNFPGESYKDDIKVRYLVLVMMDPQAPPVDPNAPVDEAKPADGDKPEGEEPDGETPADVDKPKDDEAAADKEDNN